MKFCKNCGAERKPNQAFCKSCGQPLQQTQSQEIQNPAPPSPQVGQRTKEPKKPISTFKKILIGILIVFAGVIVGAHFYLESLYSPQKTGEAFEKAILNEDIKSAKEIIDFSNVSKDISDKEVSSYVAYLKGNQKDWTTKLRQAAIDAENEGFSSAIIEDQNQNQLFQLVQSGKKFGLYQQYKMEAIPFELEISSNLANVEVDYLGKKETLKEDGLTLTTLPSKNEITGNFTGEYVKLSEKEELAFKEGEKNTLVVYLDFDYNHMEVLTNEENSILYVNGKSTGQKIGEVLQLSPLPMNETIVLHAEYKTDSGVVKSNKYEGVNTGEVFLAFDHSDEKENTSSSNPDSETPDNEAEKPTSSDPDSETPGTEAEKPASSDPSSDASTIGKFITGYVYSGINAMNAGDFSLVEPYLDPAGKSYQESKDYVDYIVSKGIKEDVISIEVINHTKTDDGYLVNTIEEFDIHYSDGTTKRKKFSSTYRIKEDGQNDYKVWALESTTEI